MAESSNKAGFEPVGAEGRLPQVGEILCGTYRLDRVLGWGAVGIVYAAWHLALRRTCAVKLLHPSFAESTDVRERFRREALSAFKLSHPYIIRVLDFREDENGWPFMVMELLVGESLRQRLSRGPLPLQQTRALYEHLCGAMALAHEQGIVHRDLKPENIFLSRQQQQGGPAGSEVEVAKVLDFGISKVTEQPEITAIHALLGSPSYMSPEQARGDARTVDARADIFSMGAILFECLTGRKAFLAADPEQKRRLILTGAVPPLAEYAAGLPATLDGVIRKACAVQPEERYQSAHDLWQALDRILAALPQGGPAPWPGEATVMTSSPPPQQQPQASPAVAPPPMEQYESTVAVQPLPPPQALHAQQGPPPDSLTTVTGLPGPLQTAQVSAVPAGSRSGPAKRVEPSGATPQAPSVLDQALLRVRPLFARSPSMLARFDRARAATQGRELVVFLGLVFVAVVISLILLETFTDSANPRIQGAPPKRIQVIDGQGHGP